MIVSFSLLPELGLACALGMRNREGRRAVFWLQDDAAYWARSGGWARLKGAIRGTVAMAHEHLQVQAGPHLQASPHGQPVFPVSALGLWHPHWQTAPGQDLQEHCVASDMVFSPFDFVDLLSTK